MNLSSRQKQRITLGRSDNLSEHSKTIFFYRIHLLFKNGVRIVLKIGCRAIENICFCRIKLLLKNGVKNILGRSDKSVDHETNYLFVVFSYFSKKGLELLWDT